MERSFKFRKLGYQDLALARKFEEWDKANDARVVGGLIDAGSMDVVLIYYENQPVGVFNVSYKVTVLGQSLFPNAVHIYGLSITLGAQARAIQSLLMSLRSFIERQYSYVVVSCLDWDRELYHILMQCGIDRSLGDITYHDSSLVESRVSLFLGTIDDVAHKASIGW